jgi:hypothetical protein
MKNCWLTKIQKFCICVVCWQDLWRKSNAKTNKLQRQVKLLGGGQARNNFFILKNIFTLLQPSFFLLVFTTNYHKNKKAKL